MLEALNSILASDRFHVRAINGRVIFLDCNPDSGLAMLFEVEESSCQRWIDGLRESDRADRSMAQESIAYEAGEGRVQFVRAMSREDFSAIAWEDFDRALTRE